jgi:hypothetical protein
MSPVATENRQAALVEESQTEATRPRLSEPRGRTLEDVILGAWEALAAGRRAECPVCGGSMSMLHGCESCGSELS